MRGSNSLSSLNVTGTTKETISLMGSRAPSLPHVFHVPWRRARHEEFASLDNLQFAVCDSLPCSLVLVRVFDYQSFCPSRDQQVAIGTDEDRCWEAGPQHSFAQRQRRGQMDGIIGT